MTDTAHYAFAYQPILSATQASVAVELIYRDAGVPAEPRANEAADAANAILSAFVHSGIDDLLRLRRAFVAASESLLKSDLLNLLPSDRFALEIAQPLALRLSVRCQELRALGFRIVLDVGAAASLGAAAALADVVKLECRRVIAGECETVFREAFAHGVQIYVYGVERPEDFDVLRRRGVHLYQGYHFAHTMQIRGERADPRKLAVLDLLAKLTADADDRVLEDSFKTDPALSLHLLRLVNSSAFALPTTIRSLKHAFVILGRAQLARWLQVLLYVLDGNAGGSPLMELALRRARFMEYVLTFRTHQTHSLLQDEAYMIGLLSLADVLMGWTMEQVATRLSLADELREALVNRNRPLGRLIVLCEALEKADFDAVAVVAEELQLSLEAVTAAQQEALVYAHRISSGGQQASSEQKDAEQGGE
ncbi:MAG: EAL domain-containing protein [Rhodocyclaceae bacterium]|nr:EAL domain-containing protein [Rhodocyclaceae bacterium]